MKNYEIDLLNYMNVWNVIWMSFLEIINVSIGEKALQWTKNVMKLHVINPNYIVLNIINFEHLSNSPLKKTNIDFGFINDILTLPWHNMANIIWHYKCAWQLKRKTQTNTCECIGQCT